MNGIVLAGVDERFLRRLRRTFGPDADDMRTWPGDITGDPAQVASELARLGTTVVALGAAAGEDEALAVAHALDVDHPEVVVILVGRPTPALMSEALRAGIRGVVAPTGTPADLRAAFEDATVAANRRRVALSDVPDLTARRRVITVLSPKGGSGKTTIATNLALGLAQHAGDGVALVDLDLQFGDVATALRLIPEHSMADLAHLESLDSTKLKVLLTPHPSGVFALCAADTPAAGEEVTADQAAAAIKQLAADFAFVVVDTPGGLGEHTLSAIEQSSDLVLVAPMDVPGVRGLRKCIDALDELGMTSARRHVVLNRADAKVGLGANDIAKTLGLEIDIYMPSSRDVPVSVNQGTPLLESQPRSPVSRTLVELVDRFLPQKGQQRADQVHQPDQRTSSWFHRKGA